MPPIYIIPILFLLGAALGMLANFMTERLLTEKTRKPTPAKYLIPFFTGVFLVFFYWFHVTRILQNVPDGIHPNYGEILTLHGRFAFQSIMLTLLLTASMIDLKEKVIPDAITVPGTLFALLVAAFFPVVLPWHEAGEKKQPVIIQPVAFVSYFSETSWEPREHDRLLLYPLTPTAPNPVFGVTRVDHGGLWGIGTALACWWLWCIGMMPRVWRTNRGVKKACGIFWARLTKEPSTRFFFSLGNAGTLVILGVFFCSQFLPPRSTMFLWTDHWLYLWTALLGMGIAGGFMWSVRFVSSLAMGREAMGFGDVILMAMLGAMLGWQPSVILFFIAPFMGLVLGLIIWIVTGDSEIPYGPFLCAAALVTILFWELLWEITMPYFSLGPVLFIFGGICLAAMVLLLGILRMIKKMMGMQK